MRDLRDAVSFHQLLLSANHRSADTLYLYMLYECAFLDYLEGRGIEPTLDQLCTTRASEFLVWYRKQPRPHRTRGGEVAVKMAASVLKRLGQILEDNDYVEANPLRKLGVPRVTKYTRTPFTEQEVNGLWGACFRSAFPARDEALLLLLLDTGCRIGEACSLRLEKVDLERRVITVMGKGRRERTIPIGDNQKRDGGRVIRALKRHLQLRVEPRPEAAPYVFLSRERRRLSEGAGNDIIKRLAEESRVEDAYPHRLRHTFCTWYLTVYPGDELGLRRIVGHVSREVLADYVHFADTTIAQRVGRASLAESWLGARSAAGGAPAANDAPHPATYPAALLRTTRRRPAYG